MVIDENIVYFECIWAADRECGIAKKGQIPWNCPQDLRKFRQITTGDPELLDNVVIMGRKTWETIPKMFKPLKDRLNIVITSNTDNVEDYEKYKEQVAFVPSFEDALTLADELRGGDIFVIGGESVYNEAIVHPGCMGIHETAISGDFECDQFTPDVPYEQFDCVEDENLSENAFYMHWLKLIDDNEEVIEKLLK